jgi:formiminotetrahydrofolate cyclodeaminase
MAVNAKDRDNLRQVALKFQKTATKLPLRVASDCLEISEFGLELYQKGFQSARGDSGVAAACSLACAQGALFVVQLNLKGFTNEDWAKECRKNTAGLLIRTELVGIEVRRYLTASLAPAACD